MGNLLCRGPPSGPPCIGLFLVAHSGFLFFPSMSNCVDCNHYIKAAASHERCRSHSDCASGPLYYGALCGVCQGLWSRARAFRDDPEDAKIAFKLLLEWVTGFRKNSRGREAGTSYFADSGEQAEFEQLRTWYNRSVRESSRDSSRSSIPSQRVSVILLLSLTYISFVCLLSLFALLLPRSPAAVTNGCPPVPFRGPTRWMGLGR